MNEWSDERDWCSPCHGPIVAKTRLGMIRDWLAFRLVMVWPNRFFMTKPHAAILPYAGTHAYTCTCWRKVAIAAATGTAETRSRLRAQASQSVIAQNHSSNSEPHNG